MVFAASMLFVVGAVIGSFANVVIGRSINALQQTVTVDWRRWLGRSRCLHCQRALRWWELLPLFSFVVLRGRCARCQEALSWQYPLIELLFGSVFLLLGLPVIQAGGGLASIVWGLSSLLTIASLLLILFVIDLKTFFLPDVLVGALGVVALLTFVISCSAAGAHCYVSGAGGAVIGAGFLFALWLITRGQGIGLGDVKLMVPLGLLFGVAGTTTVLFIAFMAGGLCGLFLLATKQATAKTAIPFGPFLTAAALLLLLFPQLPEFFVVNLLGLTVVQ